MGRRWGTSRRTVVAAAVVVLQLVVCVAVALMPFDGAPHGAPVGVVAPPIVASSLADQANALEGRPVRAEPVTSVGAARADVRTGRSVAALVVDLRRNTAVLMVSSAQGDDLTTAVGDAVRSLARPFAATVTVRDVAPRPPGSAGRGGLLLAMAAAVLAGLAIAVAVTWRRGPVADTWPEARHRVLLAAGTSAVVSVVIAVVASHQIGGDVVRWWVVAMLAVTATNAATMALEGLLGVAGIGVSTTVFVLTAAPLVRADHPWLLPTPWSEVTPWLPHGAALEAAGQVAWYGGAGTARPVAVLLAWVVVSLVTLAISRRERRRAGVLLNQPA